MKDEDWGDPRRSQIGLAQQQTNQHSSDLQIPSGWSVSRSLVRWFSQSGLRSDYLASCSERSSFALSIASPQASLPCTLDRTGGRVHLRIHPCFHVPTSSEWMNGWILTYSPSSPPNEVHANLLITRLCTERISPKKMWQVQTAYFEKSLTPFSRILFSITVLRHCSLTVFSQINLVHILPPYVLKIHFNIIIRSRPTPFRRFSHHLTRSSALFKASCFQTSSTFLTIWSILPIVYWHSWLRHCATSRKVAVSIPDGAIEIFHWHNPSGRTMALGLTQPLTEMSTRNNSWWGKDRRYVGLTTVPPSCAYCLEIWEPQPPGTLRACPDL